MSISQEQKGKSKQLDRDLPEVGSNEFSKAIETYLTSPQTDLEEVFGSSQQLPKSGDVRRFQQRSSTNAPPFRSPSFEQDLLINLELADKLASEDPKTKLKRLLSIHSAISTGSSFAERQQAAIDTKASYRHIGRGTCGTIFEIPGTTFALKVAKTDSDALWNDFTMHMRVLSQFDNLPQINSEIHVPRCHWYASATDDEWWDENLERFPKEHQFRNNTICFERILPIPKIIRESLIDEYCPSSFRVNAKADPSNKDCLVRLYLGKRREPRPSRFFTLRNFLLHIDQMEDLEHDVDELAANMADALAVMHWHVRIDADDVEFVLGSAPTRSTIPTLRKPLMLADICSMPKNTSTWASSFENFKYRTVHMWMIDFDRCKDISMDREGVEQAVTSFFKNDPYYPRPYGQTSRDQKLWATFKDRYLRTSFELIGNGPEKSLPIMFIAQVEEAQRRRMERRRDTAA
ncbi:MAG: hypothetical protein M1839_001677 [Geoglossum umbratile]|nr:MAG: hypothetical protein M1839_001677 [Geoglossum umbratile]